MINPIEAGIQNTYPELKTISPIEWPNIDVSEVDKEISDGAYAIRLFYFRQIPLLRQIPYLALEVNGRGIWKNSFSRAYYKGMIDIHESRGYYDMFLELRTGVLLSTNPSPNCNENIPLERFGLNLDDSLYLATDKEIFTKLGHQDKDERFIPTHVIDLMQEMIKRPYHNNPEEVEREIAQKEMAKLGLDRMMKELPEDEVIENLRVQGFEI